MTVGARARTRRAARWLALVGVAAGIGCRAPARMEPPPPGPTIEERVAQYGPAARARLAPFSAAAGVPYPPARFGLLALKQERDRQLFAASAEAPLAFVRSFTIQGASGVLGPKSARATARCPRASTLSCT